MLPYKEAIWNFLLEKGGTYEFYGSYGHDSKKIRNHVKTCGLNLSKMSTPEMGTVGEFAGSFAEGTMVAVVEGYLICNCDKYPDSKFDYQKVHWILRNYSLGELIWHVVKAGEKK